MHRGPVHTCPAAGEGSPCWPRDSPPCVHALGWAVTLLVLSLLSLLEDEPGQRTGKWETLRNRAGGPSRATLEQPAPADPQLTTGAGASPAHTSPPPRGERVNVLLGPPCAARHSGTPPPALADRAASGSRLSMPPAWAKPTPRPSMSTHRPAQSVTWTHQPGPNTSLGEQGWQLSSPPHRRQWAL